MQACKAKGLKTQQIWSFILQTFLRGSPVLQAEIISLVGLNPSGCNRLEWELSSTHTAPHPIVVSHSKTSEGANAARGKKTHLDSLLINDLCLMSAYTVKMLQLAAKTKTQTNTLVERGTLYITVSDMKKYSFQI